MPGFRGHVAGALLVFAVILVACGMYVKDPIRLLNWLFFMIAGTLFPDIDTQSKGKGLFYRLAALILLVLIIFKAWSAMMFLAVFLILPRLVRHRGIFHNVWFIAVLVFCVAAFCVYTFPYKRQEIIINAVFFFIGAVTHLWLDLGFKRMLKMR